MAGTNPGRQGYGLDALEVLPEFAAQVAGYVHSPQRREGLYLLADVGAGTLDLACFRILLKEAPEFPVFASKVEPLGTHYLMRARSNLAAGAGWATLGKVLPAPEFAKRVGCSVEDVSKVDRDFAGLVSQSVQSVLTETRFRMDRRAVEWKEGLPVFMAGGGSSIQVYRDGVRMALKGIGSRERIRHLPAPGSVHANFTVDDEAFSRMSVAFGLSYDAELIGRLIPPDKIPPDPPPTLTRDKQSHEDLYSKS